MGTTVYDEMSVSELTDMIKVIASRIESEFYIGDRNELHDASLRKMMNELNELYYQLDTRITKSGI